MADDHKTASSEETHSPEDKSAEQGDMSKDKIQEDAFKDAEKLKSDNNK